MGQPATEESASRWRQGWQQRACAKVEVANTRCTALPSVWPVTQGMIGRTRWKTTRANCFLRRALVPTLCLKKFTCLSCTPEARNSPPACSQQTHAGISEGELVELRQQVIAPAAQHAAGAVRRPQARLPLLRGVRRVLWPRRRGRAPTSPRSLRHVPAHKAPADARTARRSHAHCRSGSCGSWCSTSARCCPRCYEVWVAHGGAQHKQPALVLVGGYAAFAFDNADYCGRRVLARV